MRIIGRKSMHDFEFVIIGAGFAGAATAYHLSRRGISDILLLEQESIPGFHSSGRNAAMMRQCVPDPDLAEVDPRRRGVLAQHSRRLVRTGAVQAKRFVVVGQRRGMGEIKA